MGTWGAAQWGTVGAMVAAAVAFAAFVVTYAQLRQSRTELQDKRIDEKVKGAIGENLLLINGLTEQARTTLEQAKESAKAIQQVDNDVRALAADLTEQRKVIDQNRSELDRTLSEAREIAAQLNTTAQRADEDAQVVSSARSIMQERFELHDRITSLLSKNGYQIATDDFSQPYPITSHHFSPTSPSIWAKPPIEHSHVSHLLIVPVVFGVTGSGNTTRLVQAFNTFRVSADLVRRRSQDSKVIALIVTNTSLPGRETINRDSLSEEEHIIEFVNFENFIDNQLNFPDS